MRNSDNEPQVKQETRDLDGILPEDIDRRMFLKGAAVTMLGGSLAGCSQQSGGNGNSSQQSGGNGNSMETSGVWQTPWNPSMNYSPAYAAQYQGFWEDTGINPLEARPGDGSSDAARRVGTGTQNIGMSNAVSEVSGLMEGYNIQIFGTAKPKSMYGLLYRKEYMDTGTDLDGKTVYTTSASTENMWPIYSQAVDAPDSVTLNYAEESSSFALFGQGEAQAVFETLNDTPTFLAQVQDDTEVGVSPLYAQLPMYGYMTYANGEWLSESGNMEYITNVMEGYSHATKWVLLNPEEALTMMRQEVNDALQTTDEETLLNQVRAGVAAPAISEDIRNNGLGYLDEEILANTLEQIGNRLDSGSPPSVDDVFVSEPQENADLATFSSDEWNQLTEFVQPYDEIFTTDTTFDTSNF